MLAIAKIEGLKHPSYVCPLTKVGDKVKNNVHHGYIHRIIKIELVDLRRRRG